MIRYIIEKNEEKQKLRHVAIGSILPEALFQDLGKNFKTVECVESIVGSRDVLKPGLSGPGPRVSLSEGTSFSSLLGIIRQLCFSCDFFKKKRPVISRRKHRSAFDQVSEFDRGRIVNYRDYGSYFREIGSRVGRNQATVMRICDRWMQEGKTDRHGRSHPTQCITSCEDRQIVRIAVTDRSVTSRIIAQHIESVTHHSVSARTIRRRLQQSGLSARRPLLGRPLTQNHRCLYRQWCDERRMWVEEWN
ncbi:transposable element Tcb1 transposase [Trichonephila clavipes]|nr:transposable element Tcb1 transposase [Trichonephila clavipes]